MDLRSWASRLAQTAFTIVTVITLSFVFTRLMPSGPMQKLRQRLIAEAGSDVDMERINRRIEVWTKVNPEKPIPEAFVDYFSSVFQGDFGRSIHYQQPVIEMIADALPWTIFYAGVALFLSFAIGIVLGALMAYYQGSRFDSATSITAVVGASVPYYVFAIILLLTLSFEFGLFPRGGGYDPDTTPGPNAAFLLSVLYHGALPILSTVLMGWAGTALSMRGNAISTLGEEYIRSANIRGLSDLRIATRYVGRNSILPLYTGLMISIGGIIGGSVILEVIFRYPGAGQLLFDAVDLRDYPLMMGGFMIITFTVVLAIMIADITYKYVDPRAGEGGKTIETYGSFRVKPFLKRKLRSLRNRQSISAGFVARSSEVGVSSGRYGGGRPGDLPFETERTVNESAAGRNVRNTLQTLWRIWDDWRLRAGTFGLSVYILMGTVGVALVDPTAQYAEERYVTPTLEDGLLFGTDKFGQDLLALTINSTPAMFKMILAGSVFATSVAVLVGIISGYRGGLTDRVAMTVSDIVLTLPGLPLTLVLVATIEPSNPYLIGLILTTASWAGLARNIRSEVLTIRDHSYVESSRFSGIGTVRVMLRDILPNLAPYILINFVSSARGVIFGAVGLYFLGILPFTNQNWGIMLNQAYNNGALLDPGRFYWIFIPMVTITGLSVSLVLMAQGLDRLFNPRIRAGEEDENGK